MVKGNQSIRFLTARGKLAATPPDCANTSCNLGRGNSALPQQCQAGSYRCPCLTLFMVIMLTYKPWQAMQWTREHTETRNMPWASTSQTSKFIVVYPGAVRPVKHVEKYPKVCSVYKTGGSKAASSSSAASGKFDNMRMSKWFILIKYLMRAYTRQDQITLFSVHVNSDAGNLNHLGYKRRFAHVNV